MSEPPSSDARPLVGDVIAGKYRIESVAGEGGMGIVYEAEHVILRQRVALKVLSPGAPPSAEAIERFSVEAAAIARLTSEHVVRVMDAGSLPTGAPYLVMEYLEGCDLERYLALNGPMPVSEVVDYALQALEALAQAHAAHLIHRDLKPANLFLAKRPDGRQIIKLLDFGIAKSFELGKEEDPDRVLGSPAYMSPEQLTNAAVDARTDLWSLGVVMYELISGKPPFTGTFAELVAGILHGPAFPLRQRVAHVPPELSNVIAKCLERDPAKRWATTAELGRALAPHGSGAWRGALDRIERALSKAAPVRAPRRFDTLETALSALEGDARPNGLKVQIKPPVLTARGPEAFGATIPAPPSNEPPITREPLTAPAPPSSKPPLRILLIDDSDIALEVQSRALSEAGFAVRTTSSPREVDDLLEAWKPHFVLMDVQMPTMSGDELCRRVKAKFKATVPVAFLSDLAPNELAELAKKGGADAFFRKTNDWGAFVEFVKNLCAITYSPEDLPDALPDALPDDPP